jgi:hypothetical protein
VSKVWSKLPIVACLVAGAFCSATLASEGRLILPTEANSNVEFVLQSERTDVLPSDVLQVFVGSRDVCCDGKSPIAGSYRVEKRRVTFDPAFDFVEGQNYTVMTRDMNAANEIDRVLTGFTVQSAGNEASPEVVAIFPSGTEIPENTLRFYIHFSAPMKPGVSGDYIKLLDENGVPDSAAFMKFKQELWSEDRMRLTLLMDPGRIKRGLTQNLALGPALLEGHRYSLVIEEGWPRATSGQKSPRFEKSFSVSKALRKLPDTALWNIEPPRELSRDSLVIHFDRPFDHQLAQRGITVLDENGQVISGTASVNNHENSWRFDPESIWTTETVRVVVDARLEDVAGNNLRELLDHSVGTDVAVIDQKTITVKLGPPSSMKRHLPSLAP